MANKMCSLDLQPSLFIDTLFKKWHTWTQTSKIRASLKIVIWINNSHHRNNLNLYTCPQNLKSLCPVFTGWLNEANVPKHQTCYWLISSAISYYLWRFYYGSGTAWNILCVVFHLISKRILWGSVVDRI